MFHYVFFATTGSGRLSELQGSGDAIMTGLDSCSLFPGLTCCYSIQNQGCASLEEGMKGHWGASQQRWPQYVPGVPLAEKKGHEFWS